VSRSLPFVLLWIQGTYFLATGLWPIINVESFQQVTGRKTDDLSTASEKDHWLVITVGVLVVAVALSLLAAAWRRRASPEVIVLAMATAIGLTGIDVIYVSRGAIPPIYLADAAAEIVLLAGWTTAIALARRQ